METEKYYKIIPKDNDPEVAKVLDFITNSAKKRFDYEKMANAFNPVVDHDFFLFQNILVNNTKEGKEKLLGETFNEFIMSGVVMEVSQLQGFMKQIEESCKLESFAMGMATDLMFHQGWHPQDVLTNITQLLGGNDSILEDKKYTEELTPKQLAEKVRDFLIKGAKSAYISEGNSDSGFLTNEKINFLPKEDLLELANSLRFLCIETAKNLDRNNVRFNQHEYSQIFQYFFDRALELFYKKLNGIDTDDVVFNIQEVFDYYEPDVPYNVQQIMTNRVKNIAMLTTKLWRYMTVSKFLDLPFKEWFSNYLILATTLGIAFGQEIDFDDESELNNFLNKMGQD